MQDLGGSVPSICEDSLDCSGGCTFTTRMGPAQYAKVDEDAIEVWCAAFEDDGESDP